MKGKIYEEYSSDRYSLEMPLGFKSIQVGRNCDLYSCFPNVFDVFAMKQKSGAGGNWGSDDEDGYDRQ